MKSIFKKKTYYEDLLLVLKGIAMGAANKIPGVSGGVVALVGGFYETLIFSFQRFNIIALKLLFNKRFRSFWIYINGRFLSLIFSGVVISYFSVSLLLDYLLNCYETLVLGCFFGMILASSYLIFTKIKIWRKSTKIFLLLGFGLGLILSYTRPISENDQLYFVFFCGIISVSGMAIPGLSGSFLLLILGNYNLLLVDAVNGLFLVLSNGFFLNFDSLSEPVIQRLLIIMGVFTIGSLSGLIIFSNLLKWILNKFPNQTLATIIGFINGTLVLVYPWRTKSFLYSDNGNMIINAVGNPIFSNYNYYLPDFKNFETYGVLLSIILGVSILLLLNYYGKKRSY
jgi:uncharacterized membrane protein